MGFELKIAANEGGYSNSMPIHSGGNRQNLLAQTIQNTLGRPCEWRTMLKARDEAREAAQREMVAVELAMLKAAVARMKGDGSSDNEDAARHP